MLPRSSRLPGPESDEELFRLFQRGDDQAFVQLVGRYKHRLTNFVFRHLGEYDEASDVVQEAFLRVYNHRHTFNSGARFTTWLYSIALNLATSELRRETRRRRYFQNGRLASFSAENSQSDPLDHSRRPDRLTETVLTFELIQAALMRLSPALREVIILREIECMSYEEIVEVTGAELGTVKSRIARGRAHLQRLLRDVYRESDVRTVA